MSTNAQGFQRPTIPHNWVPPTQEMYELVHALEFSTDVEKKFSPLLNHVVTPVGIGDELKAMPMNYYQLKWLCIQDGYFAGFEEATCYEDLLENRESYFERMDNLNKEKQNDHNLKMCLQENKLPLHLQDTITM